MVYAYRKLIVFGDQNLVEVQNLETLKLVLLASNLVKLIIFMLISHDTLHFDCRLD